MKLQHILPKCKIERLASIPKPSSRPDGARSSKKSEKPVREEVGFLLRVFPRERRYAELGYLLPFYLRPAVKTRCIGPSSWHAIYIYPNTVRTFGYAPVGHGHDLSQLFG